MEALTPDFGRKFWDFIKAGGYEHRAKSSGTPQFYRFDRPTQPEFPYMLELFSRKGDIFENESVGPCVPIPLGDEVSSLSAILLNEDYYTLLLQGRTEIDGVSILSPQYLIPFKAKAWLDLSTRKQQGEQVDEKDIRKHKNDVARLTTLLTGEERCPLPPAIQREMQAFLAHLEELLAFARKTPRTDADFVPAVSDNPSDIGCASGLLPDHQRDRTDEHQESLHRPVGGAAVHRRYQ